MEVEYLRFPHKQIRARVIKEFLTGKKYKGVVCFSCGNASEALRDVGLDIIEISPQGDFIPNRWFQPSEVATVFEGYFDATSGHLSPELMLKLAAAYRAYLGDELYSHYIPTGSGETILCLKLAYPQDEFIAVYNLDLATQYDSKAVLNGFVSAVAKEIIFADVDIWADH